MKAKQFYKSRTLNGMAIFINYILKRDSDEYLLNVTWYRTDDATGKLVSMDVEQEAYFKPNEWVLL